MLKKKTSHKKQKSVIVSLLLVLSAVSGYVRGISIRNARAEKSAASVATTLAQLDRTPEGVAYLSQNYRHHELPSVVDNAEPKVQNSVSNQLFQALRPFVPANTSSNTLWLYTSTLEKLSTGTNNVCTATNMPSTNFFHFAQMATKIPTNELQNFITGTNTLFSFKDLKNAFKNPSNTFNFAQTVFEQGAHYQLLDRLTISLPKHEGNTYHIYWDTAKKDDGTHDPQPTISVGLNLKARPDLLRQLRFKNSKFIQTIIHSDPKDRVSDEYIYLSEEELARLTVHACKNHWNQKANDYKEIYGLSVHEDDKDILDTYFKNKVVACILRTERELDSLKPKNFSDGSAMFGTYLTPVEGAPDVAVDIKWNTGNNLANDWPKFCRNYLFRTFGVAKKECHVKDEPFRRKWWKNSLMNSAIKKQKEYQQRLQTRQQTK